MDYCDSINIPIDRGNTPRNTMVPMIRLYNPCRIVSQNQGVCLPRYKFWNPLNPSDALKAAYGYSDPWTKPRDIPPVTGRCPLPSRSSSTDNVFRRYIDDMNRWVFGDEYVSPFSRYHDDSFNSIMDVGRAVLNNTWDMMEPFHKMWMYPRDLDENNSGPSVDLQNYRISRAREPLGKPRVCPLRDPLLYSHSGTFRDSREQSDMNIIRKEDDRSYKLSFTIPNVNAKNIKIKIRDGLLTVSGHAERVKRGDHDSEMRYSESFQHSVSLPRDAMELDAKARLRNDTLTIKSEKTL
uniref:Heat shock protein hsp20 n=1 Tax=Babesia bovis TaxID=5865 RepID=S6BLC2_BABBO|nr:heat shock protein hsp20 [Babesia bovis]